MGKRTGEHQDYYKLSGEQPGPETTYEQEQAKLRATKGARGARSAREPPRHKPAVAASGAGTETVIRSQKRREAHEKKQRAESAQRAEVEVSRDEVERMVTANVAAAPPDRQLPAASASTEWSDFVREVRGDLETIARAFHELVDSLHDLAISPVRLYRVLRGALAGAG